MTTTTTTFLDTALTNLTTYYYRIRATNDSGTGAPSSPSVSATPAEDGITELRIKRRQRTYYLNRELYPDGFVWDATVMGEDMGYVLVNNADIQEQLWPEPAPAPLRVSFVVRMWSTPPYVESNPFDYQSYIKEVDPDYTLQTGWNYVIPSVALGNENWL